MTNERAIPEGYMTVGEVAKKMGVTVRTLQYYDKEGLFSPSGKSEGGRRLYTDKDLVRLHQILSLKSLGFSLEDIRSIKELGRNRIHITVGSALDLYGGRLPFDSVMDYAQEEM